MTRLRLSLLITIGISVTTGIVFADNLRNLRANLSGYEEVPTRSEVRSALTMPGTETLVSSASPSGAGSRNASRDGESGLC